MPVKINPFNLYRGPKAKKLTIFMIFYESNKHKEKN